MTSQWGRLISLYPVGGKSCLITPPADTCHLYVLCQLRKKYSSSFALFLSPLSAQSKEQARQPIGGSDSSSCDTSSTNGHQQQQHIKSPASRTVSAGTTNCKRGATPPSSSPTPPMSSSLPSTSSDYLQKRPSEVTSSSKDMNQTQQQATTTTPKKKQRADFKFGKILGEGSYSEVSIFILVPYFLLGTDGTGKHVVKYTLL